MRPLSALALIGPLTALVIACTAQGAGSQAEAEESVSNVSSALGTPGCPTCTWTLPTPGSKDNAIPAAEKAAIIAEWTQMAKDYYAVAGSTPGGYVSWKKADGTVGTSAVQPYTEVAACLGACPAYYSDLVAHFYSHMPSYGQVVPNVRGCFSNLARGGIPGSPSRLYPDIWDYCMYQDYDAVKNATQPQWSATEINARVEKGVLSHMAPSLRPVFQYIMYTSYEPATYKQADQMEIITAVYKNLGQPIPAPLAGRASNPNAAQIAQGMSAYFTAHGGLSLAGAGKVSPTPAPPAAPATPPPGADAICKTLPASPAIPATATTQALAAATAGGNCKTCCTLSHANDGAAAASNTATCAASCPP